MHRLRVLVVLVIVTATLGLALPVGAATGVVAEAHRARTTTCSSAYLDGDSRLGPQQLPNAGPIAPIVRGYHRFAGLTEQEFLTTYWDPTANGGSGGWRYPPDNGFLLDPGGTPIEFTWSLQAGQKIDRFGSEFGAFLAPEDTPYAERALPPEMIPHRLFDRLFGQREEGWVNRKRSILDAVSQDMTTLKKKLPSDDQARLDEHLSGIRDMERSIAGLPPEYRRVDPPSFPSSSVSH